MNDRWFIAFLVLQCLYFCSKATHVTSAHWALFLCASFWKIDSHHGRYQNLFLFFVLFSCVSPVALFPILFYCSFSSVSWFLEFALCLFLFWSLDVCLCPSVYASSYWFSSCCLQNIPSRTAHWSLKKCPVNNVLLSRRYVVFWWDNISMSKDAL